MVSIRPWLWITDSLGFTDLCHSLFSDIFALYVHLNHLQHSTIRRGFKPVDRIINGGHVPQAYKPCMCGWILVGEMDLKSQAQSTNLQSCIRSISIYPTEAYPLNTVRHQLRAIAPSPSRARGLALVGLLTHPTLQILSVRSNWVITVPPREIRRARHTTDRQVHECGNWGGDSWRCVAANQLEGPANVRHSQQKPVASIAHKLQGLLV